MPVWKNCWSPVRYLLCCSINNFESSLQTLTWAISSRETVKGFVTQLNQFNTDSCSLPALHSWCGVTDIKKSELWLLGSEMASPIRSSLLFTRWVIDDIKAAPQTLLLKALAGSSSASPLTEEWWSGSGGLKEKSAVMSSPLMRWEE